jgi:hypothetical protein
MSKLRLALIVPTVFSAFFASLYTSYAQSSASISPTPTVSVNATLAPSSAVAEFAFLQNALVPLTLVAVPVLLLLFVAAILYKRKN